ncbi:MAG TPA: L-rhamnose catabolism isomerase [Bacteroidota bacterium]|nr:L-rhamnose catabolism isomerase [Bacteroidota bacterium]
MKETGFRIDDAFVQRENDKAASLVKRDYDALSERLERRGIAIDTIAEQVRRFEVAIPSWGVGTGGTRFARFPGVGEPRTISEKLVDCATIHQLTRTTPRVSLHIPWDIPGDVKEFLSLARHLGIGFDAMNSNTFQDQPGQGVSYKFGSLTHTDPAVRKAAVDHNKECIEIGKKLGSSALTVWIGDGGNFPGQIDFRASFQRYLESVRAIYGALPSDWRLFIEYKPYEPSFYSTVINDWGTAYFAATQLGPQALCLVDLGHHAPNVNIELIVARLIQSGKLGGFHFNDSKYGDDDLDAGSIKPFQLFLIFCELVGGAADVPGFSPAFMIDQSHNVTDPIESLMVSAEELQRGYAQALLVDRAVLREFQTNNDAVMSLRTLKEAFTTDVTPILQKVRLKAGGAIDPVSVYRASGYRKAKQKERPEIEGSKSGIV